MLNKLYIVCVCVCVVAMFSLGSSRKRIQIGSYYEFNNNKHWFNIIETNISIHSSLYLHNAKIIYKNVKEKHAMSIIW